MNIWKISLANIKSKPIYSLLSVLTLSLSFALLFGVQQLKTSFEYQIAQNLGKVDMVVGAKGSPLQLVLSSILQIDNPTGNIDYSVYKKLADHRMVDSAVPISIGDNYKGYRIVGTTHEFLNLYDAAILKGRKVQKSMEVVLGSDVAQKNNLKLGDHFFSSHGLVSQAIDVHEDELTVVGILKPTHKVIDRLILANLATVWDVHSHEDHEEEEEHEHEEQAHDHDQHDDHGEEDERQITSLLVSFRSPTALLTMPKSINQETNLQAALPKYELKKLYEYMGIGFGVVKWIAYAILMIAIIIIFTSLYKMIKERAFDFALLRTYGASKFQLIMIGSYEALIVVAFSFLIGLILSQGGFYLVEVINEQHLLIALPYQNMLYMMLVLLFIIILSISFVIYPITKMNISKVLSNEK
jgi:putative ABC transport system permease protein